MININLIKRQLRYELLVPKSVKDPEPYIEGMKLMDYVVRKGIGEPTFSIDDMLIPPCRTNTAKVPEYQKLKPYISK